MDLKMKRIYGVDMGGTTIKLGCFDPLGVLQEKWEIPTRKEENGRYVFDDIAAAVKGHIQGSGLSLQAVAGIGIGLPASVREDGYIEQCVNIGFRELFPAAELSRRLEQLPVACANDANVAALGEAWKGGGAGYDSMFLITLGTGVGGGAICGGKILTGSKGLAGEIGHMIVRPEEAEVCNCGNRGCLEQVASATGLVREAGRILAESEAASILRQVQPLTAKDVLDAAKTGDSLAVQAAERMGFYLAWAMSSVTHILDPAVFVLGGGVSMAGSYLIDCIRGPYERMTNLSSRKAEIHLAVLGNDAGIYGAARLMLEEGLF